MVKKPSKRAWKWIIAGVAVAIVAFIGVKYVLKRQERAARGHRLGQRPDRGRSWSTSPRRSRCGCKEILVDEGALVKPGQVLVRMDTVTLDSELAEANAAVQAAEEKLAGARANIVKQKSEIDLADVEADAFQAAGPAGRRLAARAGRAHDEGGDDEGRPRPRSRRCWRPPRRTSRSRAGTRRRSRRASTTRRCDRPSRGACSTGWRSRARCSAAGGKALTLVNLDDIYMEIFLPSEQAAAREGRRRRAGHGRLRTEARDRRPGQLRLARGAVHAQAGRDQERAREADVPREDPAVQGRRRPVHRAHQDGRPRGRLRQGEGFGGLAGAPAEPGRRRGPGGRRSTGRE